MKLDFLRTFIKIARYGNLTRAAEEMGISQPAITKQIKTLEQEFGAELLIRKQKRIELSAAGLVLEMYAKQVLNLVDRAKCDIAKLHETVSGSLTVAASTIPGDYILPFIAGEFSREFPRVQLSFVSGDTGEVIKKVLDNAVQVGAVGACPDHRQLICRRFFADRLVLITPPGHPWAKARHISVRELIKGAYIWREKGSGTRQSIEKILASQGIEVGWLNIAFELGSTESVIAAVEAGYGVSFVSRWSAQNAVQLGRLKEVEIIGFDGSRDLYLICLKSDPVSKIVETFIDFAVSPTIQEKLFKYLHKRAPE